MQNKASGMLVYHSYQICCSLPTKETLLVKVILELIMARQPQNLPIVAIICLCFTLLLLTSIEGRRLNLPKHRYHHHHHHVQTTSHHNIGANKRQLLDIFVNIRVVKNSGPSPGEGHFFTTGTHN